MSTPAIIVDNLSKLYRLGQVGTGTLSHDLNRLWARLRGKPDPYAKVGATNDRAKDEGDTKKGYVWALKDINFEVQPGEVLGIIGKNGAGKSTLLKLLSRVTAPTTGKIHLNGRVASLLEVGTGFHPELTGRENIFLNGAILGMTRAEIKGRFDDIVDFAGCAKYIDTPVKRYSSGMYVRLAFAVAAHLEPEILIVDEVLAVGDAEFQKRCIGKMKEVSEKGGRTVLFVSHNLVSVQSICSRCLLIANGTLTAAGTTESIVGQYLRSNLSLGATSLAERRDRQGSGDLTFTKTWTSNGQDEPSDSHLSGGHLRISAEFNTTEPLRSLYVSIAIYGETGTQVCDLPSKCYTSVWEVEKGRGVVHCDIPRLPLNQGKYSYNLYAKSGNTKLDAIEHAGVFSVDQADFYRTGIMPPPSQGHTLIDASYRLQAI